MSHPGRFPSYPARDTVRDSEILQKTEDAARSGDLATAIRLARSALSGGLVSPLLLNLRAFAFEQEGRNQEALADLRRATTIAPGDPLIWNAYGLCLAKLDQRREAIAAFETAARLAPEFAPAQFNLGWSHEAIGELDTARQCYEKAISLAPSDPTPLGHLAMLAARRGDWEGAAGLAEKALSLNANSYPALAAKIMSSTAVGAWQASADDIAYVLDQSDVPPIDRSITLGLKGDLLHSQRRFAEAFGAYSQANEIRRSIFAPTFEAKGRETAYTYTVWLADYFENASSTQWAADKTSSLSTEESPSEHVFLTGFTRSGTTLLENILGSHRQICALDEKELLADSVRAFLANAAGRDRLATAQDDSLALLRERYWQQANSFGIDVTGKVFVDKNPLASIKLAVVAKLFPRAKILFAIRDPRDVVLSCFRRQFQMNPSNFEFLTLEGAARFYAAVMRLAMLYREKLVLDWYDLRYERLVDDIEGECRRVCDFIGLPWDDAMLTFVERAKDRAIATPSSVQVVRGINREGVDVWRNYSRQLEPVLPILQPWIEKFGYAID